MWMDNAEIVCTSLFSLIQSGLGKISFQEKKEAKGCTTNFSKIVLGSPRFIRITFVSIDRVEIQCPRSISNISTSAKLSAPFPPPIAKILSFRAAPAKLPFFIFNGGRIVHWLLTRLYDSTSQEENDKVDNINIMHHTYIYKCREREVQAKTCVKP